MYLRILGMEMWAERIVAKGQKWLDWYISKDETHIWMGRIHILMNRRFE